MDWISDHHLSKLKSEDSGIDGEKPLLRFGSERNDIQEKCVKVCFLIWHTCFGRHEDLKRKAYGMFYKGKILKVIFIENWAYQ